MTDISKIGPKVLGSVLAVLLLFGLFGCSQPTTTRIELTSFEQGRQEVHYTQFQHCYYRMMSDGRIELVIQTRTPSETDPTQFIEQILHIKSFWLPQPGRTYVETTQINARFQYAILTPPTGVRYDGAGFVTHDDVRGSDGIAGELESGELAPKHRLGNAVEPFGPVRITGEFRAEEDPGKVLELARRIEALFE